MTSESSELAVVYYDIQPIHEGYISAARFMVESQLTVSAGYFDQSPEDLRASVAVSEQGTLLGVSCLSYPEDDDAPAHLYDTRTATLQYLAVHEAYQAKHGIGSALLRHAEYRVSRERLDSMFLESVGTAESFYTKHGYRVIPPKEIDFDSKECLVPMMKQLPSLR